jgi:flagellar biosynthesis/type III secretory pathway chaperone
MKLEEINGLLDLAQDNVIDEKKILVADLEELEEARASNNFLEKIANDYVKYKDALLRQKERQHIELIKLIGYLDEILESQSIANYSLDHTKNEQRRLIQEIQQIQREMDEINLD